MLGPVSSSPIDSPFRGRDFYGAPLGAPSIFLTFSGEILAPGVWSGLNEYRNHLLSPYQTPWECVSSENRGKKALLPYHWQVLRYLVNNRRGPGNTGVVERGEAG